MGNPTSVLNKLLASKGALLITGTTANTSDGYGIVVREDTVIEAWTDEDGNDLLAKFGITTEVTVLTTDDIALIIPGGLGNGSIKLTSGSVWLLK